MVFAKEKDPWISRDFYMHARKLALHAEIVITNHAMLLVDMEKEKAYCLKRILSS
ncbi:hypothetical protein ACI2OX_10895 [Bacillus sp. N9]